MAEQKKVALVTGAAHGLGKEICRQLAGQGYAVLLGARDREKGEAAAKELRTATSGPILVQVLDITDPASVEAARERVATEFGKLDALINNAASGFDFTERTSTVNLDAVRQTLETNVLGSWRMCQVFLPLLRKSAAARIVNVSSGSGSFGDEQFGLLAQGGALPAYAVSKTALTAFTIKLALDLKDENILVNAVDPGFTATYPGMEEMGARPVAEGAAGIVWAATLPATADSPTGGFFRDREPLPW